MHDVESRCRENLRTQSEASMPASSNHFTTLFLAKILRTKTRYDFRFLQLCPEIIDVLYPDCAQFIESCFQRFSSISKHNAVRQTSGGSSFSALGWPVGGGQLISWRGQWPLR